MHYLQKTQQCVSVRAFLVSAAIKDEVSLVFKPEVAAENSSNLAKDTATAFNETADFQILLKKYRQF